MTTPSICLHFGIKGRRVTEPCKLDVQLDGGLVKQGWEAISVRSATLHSGGTVGASIATSIARAMVGSACGDD